MDFKTYYLNENKEITLFHGSSVPIKKFNRTFSAQGVFWFSENKEKILKGESGAVSSNYIMTCKVNINKTAGWVEYDTLGLDEIINKGYDSIQLDDDWIIFDSKNIKIINIEKIK